MAEIQDRALQLSDSLDVPIETAEELRSGLMGLATPSREEQRRLEHLADAIQHLREAKGALFRAGKE